MTTQTSAGRGLFKFAHNYIGTQIRAEMSGRVFLGDVVNARPAGKDFVLEVRHFDGSRWPFDPQASKVEILERDVDRPLTLDEQRTLVKCLSMVYGS